MDPAGLEVGRYGIVPSLVAFSDGGEDTQHPRKVKVTLLQLSVEVGLVQLINLAKRGRSDGTVPLPLEEERRLTEKTAAHERGKDRLAVLRYHLNGTPFQEEHLLAHVIGVDEDIVGGKNAQLETKSQSLDDLIAAKVEKGTMTDVPLSGFGQIKLQSIRQGTDEAVVVVTERNPSFSTTTSIVSDSPRRP